jgi:hypothetical protein
MQEVDGLFHQYRVFAAINHEEVTTPSVYLIFPLLSDPRNSHRFEWTNSFFQRIVFVVDLLIQKKLNKKQ